MLREIFFIVNECFDLLWMYTKTIIIIIQFLDILPNNRWKWLCQELHWISLRWSIECYGSWLFLVLSNTWISILYFTAKKISIKYFFWDSFMFHIFWAQLHPYLPSQFYQLHDFSSKLDVLENIISAFRLSKMQKQ